MLTLPLTWRMPTNLLTAFVAIRLSVRNVEVDDIRLSLLLPASGMPDNRITHVLRNLIDSPERFMRFLRALLGGLDSLLDGVDSGRQRWSNHSAGALALAASRCWRT